MTTATGGTIFQLTFACHACPYTIPVEISVDKMFANWDTDIPEHIKQQAAEHAYNRHRCTKANTN